MKAMTEDDSFLYDVEQAWPDFLPVNPHQRDSYSRLLKKGSPLWAGRIRHTRRTPDPAWPTTAGLLCHTPPLPFSPERTGVITGTERKQQCTRRATLALYPRPCVVLAVGGQPTD